ncbi:hypothetical protein K402DRAFT_392265 [Aulographum hederae CBS 113979]|uniref:Uncharacterized protein n=1 Tax=Aulographum hederae CBS 113979 TaxID=1176131 RepID=A0A6G1H4K0_9PEZI|nr:hypothetical protein K402DRAFT_392265 [Aulographum hederae CBS 113979]
MDAQEGGYLHGFINNFVGYNGVGSSHSRGPPPSSSGGHHNPGNSFDMTGPRNNDNNNSLGTSSPGGLARSRSIGGGSPGGGNRSGLGHTRTKSVPSLKTHLASVKEESDETA